MKATKEMLEMAINKRTQEVSNLAWELPKNKGEKFEYETIKDITTLMTEKIIELNNLLREYRIMQTEVQDEAE